MHLSNIQLSRVDCISNIIVINYYFLENLGGNNRFRNTLSKITYSDLAPYGHDLAQGSIILMITFNKYMIMRWKNCKKY